MYKVIEHRDDLLLFEKIRNDVQRIYETSEIQGDSILVTFKIAESEDELKYFSDNYIEKLKNILKKYNIVNNENEINIVHENIKYNWNINKQGVYIISSGFEVYKIIRAIKIDKNKILCLSLYNNNIIIQEEENNRKKLNNIYIENNIFKERTKQEKEKIQQMLNNDFKNINNKIINIIRNIYNNKRV